MTINMQEEEHQEVVFLSRHCCVADESVTDLVTPMSIITPLVSWKGNRGSKPASAMAGILGQGGRRRMSWGCVTLSGQ